MESFDRGRMLIADPSLTDDFIVGGHEGNSAVDRTAVDLGARRQGMIQGSIEIPTSITAK